VDATWGCWSPTGQDIITHCVLPIIGEIDANEMSLSLDHEQVGAIIFKRFWASIVIL
jgi:hypothetical protein